MPEPPSATSHARSRYSLRIHTGADGGSIAVCIDDLLRNAVLFDWRGPEARCLLESHDLLRRHAMSRHAADRGVPISKTSIWHLALHVAAIRCLLNRCDDDRARANRPANGSVNGSAIDGAGADAEYRDIHLEVLKLLRAGGSRLLSAQDITCLLALQGRTYSSTCVRRVLDDLYRWGAVRRFHDKEDEAFYRAALVINDSGNDERRMTRPGMARVLSATQH